MATPNKLCSTFTVGPYTIHAEAPRGGRWIFKPVNAFGLFVDLDRVAASVGMSVDQLRKSLVHSLKNPRHAALERERRVDAKKCEAAVDGMIARGEARPQDRATLAAGLRALAR
jgi:hypothetical protein